MVNENIVIEQGWNLSVADGSLIVSDETDDFLITTDDEDEWIQPETINAKIDRLENHIIKLTERIDEILKMFWN